MVSQCTLAVSTVRVKCEIIMSVLVCSIAGREATDEYDHENTAKRGGQDGVCKSVAENKRDADAALSHGNA